MKFSSFLTQICVVYFLVGCTEPPTSENPGNDTKDKDSNDIAEDGNDADADSDSDSDADSDSDSDDDNDDTETKAEKGDPGASLVGTWGELRVLAAVAKNVPIVGQTWTSARGWFLVDIASDGKGNLTLTEYGCSARGKSSTAGASAEDQDAQLRTFLPEERFVTVTSSKPGTPFVSNMQYATKGLNLCDPAKDPPPAPAGTKDSTPCDAPCTGSHCDEDGDGHPGITGKGQLLNTIKCDAYFSAVTISKMKGEIVDADTIEGPMINKGGYSVVHGATNPLCATNSPPASVDECAAHHYFKLVRLAKGADCDDMMELTDCDEDYVKCDSNEKLPLDPNPDTPACN